jgi:hypothetical protein
MSPRSSCSRQIPIDVNINRTWDVPLEIALLVRATIQIVASVKEAQRRIVKVLRQPMR